MVRMEDASTLSISQDASEPRETLPERASGSQRQADHVSQRRGSRMSRLGQHVASMVALEGQIESTLAEIVALALSKGGGFLGR